MCARKLRSLSFCIAVAAVWPSARPAAAQAIADNSFLIEEAYNQESGVVQHISVWQRDLRSRVWAFTFTQEWPLGGQTHQLSYTIPLQRTIGTSGLGDAALHYRYQVRADARVAIAPRLSLLVPTGSARRGLGTGHVGAQLNLPLSVTLAPALVTHWNAGVTAVAHQTTYNVGASAIWLARSTFNVLCEVVWMEQGGEHDFVVNPGVRWAYNFTSGLQIVPGVGYTVGLGPSRGQRGALLYLSLENRYRRESDKE
jgi:hypothetical protein